MYCCTASVPQDYGTVYLNVMFIPFFQPSFDDEEELSEVRGRDDCFY